MSAVDPVREHFNAVAAGKEYASYEDRRWAANPKQEEQRLATETFVTTIVTPMVAGASHVVELGAGPGTWTKYLLAAAPTARFTLTDIAGEMLARARTVFPGSTVVETVESDFISAPLPHEAADFFFSSRAVEYITPQDQAARKIADVLTSGGRGAVITKMPKRILNGLLGRTASKLHSTQMRPSELVRHLRQAGLTDINVYPVTFSFPLLRSSGADRILARLFATHRLNPLSSLFVESYGVTFHKP